MERTMIANHDSQGTVQLNVLQRKQNVMLR